MYQDEDVIALKSFGAQLPVHLLVIPKKRIATINDVSENEAQLLGKMILVAKQLAKEQGISETGYRLVFNTNEDAGQSAFHIHLHVLGGHRTGPMVDQKWRNSGPNPGSTYKKALENVKDIFDQQRKAIQLQDSSSFLNTMTDKAVFMPPGHLPLTGKQQIKTFFFKKNSPKLTMGHEEEKMDEIKLDGQSAIVRSTLIQTASQKLKSGKKITITKKQYHLSYFEQQEDQSWLMTQRIWTEVK